MTTQQAEYAALLKGMYWQFEFSDDMRVYRAGRDTLDKLRTLQPLVDPEGAQWIAASGTKHGVPQPMPKLLSDVHPALADSFTGLLALGVRS